MSETYAAIFGIAHPNWLVGSLAIVGLVWFATFAVRVWWWGAKLMFGALRNG